MNVTVAFVVILYFTMADLQSGMDIDWRRLGGVLLGGGGVSESVYMGAPVITRMHALSLSIWGHQLMVFVFTLHVYLLI